MLTPTTTIPLERMRFCISIIEGNSSTQGGHQVAQKLIQADLVIGILHRELFSRGPDMRRPRTRVTSCRQHNEPDRGRQIEPLHVRKPPECWIRGCGRNPGTV